MDPISAIGVAASIGQFVATGVIVVKRLKEYNAAVSDVPKSLESIAIQLPLLLNSLERVQTEVKADKVDLDTRCILKGVVAGCRGQVEKLERIIGKVLLDSGDSLGTRVRKVFTGLKNDDKVLAIEKNLQTYISVLILHSVIEGPELPPAAVADQFFSAPIVKVSPFIERPELMRELETHLKDAAASHVQDPVVVHLVGGNMAGKTQLALAYCTQAHAIGHFQTVFWLDASTLEKLWRSLEGVAATIRRSREGLRDRTERIDFVKTFLSNRWHPWLLILDNYDSTRCKDALDYLPSNGHGAMIFISHRGPSDGSDTVVQVPRFRTPEELQQIENAFISAVRSNKVAEAERQLENGADVNSCYDNWPCLHRAIAGGHTDMVRLLLAKGASCIPLNGWDDYEERSALFWAANYGDISMFQMVLDHGIATKSPPQEKENNGMLRAASNKGKNEIVRLILSRGDVQINDSDKSGKTALWKAISYRHADTVKILLENGANAEFEAQGERPLLEAINNGYLEIVNLLCGLGKADMNLRAPAMTYGYATALQVATRKGPLMVKSLLDFGADPNYPSLKDGKCPLHNATEAGQEETVKLLLDHGAKPDHVDHEGNTPVSNAVKKNHPNILSLLLKQKPSDPGNKAMMLAIHKGDRDMMLSLRECGFDPNLQDKAGTTPLLHALEHGHIPTARMLFRWGASAEQPDARGRIPLFLAAEAGHDLLVKDFLRAGISPNIRSTDENTPLCASSANGHEKVVKLLLEHGADPDMSNKYGETPLDLAEEKEREKVIALLQGLAVNGTNGKV